MKAVLIKFDGGSEMIVNLEKNLGWRVDEKWLNLDPASGWDFKFHGALESGRGLSYFYAGELTSSHHPVKSITFFDTDELVALKAANEKVPLVDPDVVARRIVRAAKAAGIEVSGTSFIKDAIQNFNVYVNGSIYNASTKGFKMAKKDKDLVITLVHTTKMS